MTTPASSNVATKQQVHDGGGNPLPVYSLTGVRVNATATASSTTQAALPSGARIVEIRATDAFFIRFGVTGMSAAAEDANSLLWTPGSGPVWVPKHTDGTLCTHFRCIRLSSASTNVPVQIEGIA